MEVPEYIRKLQKDLERTDQDVAAQRRYLQLDEVFTFTSKNPQFADRPLKFRKLRNKEVLVITKLMPEIPEGQAATDEQSIQLHEAIATALAMASVDKISILAFRDMEDLLLGEACEFVLGLIGCTKDSVENLNWFRKQ